MPIELGVSIGLGHLRESGSFIAKRMSFKRMVHVLGEWNHALRS